MENNSENKPAQTKPPYQKPVVMPLGELARGQGVCSPVGSLPTGTCTDGAEAVVGAVCKFGPMPKMHCRLGGSL